MNGRLTLLCLILVALPEPARAAPFGRAAHEVSGPLHSRLLRARLVAPGDEAAERYLKAETKKLQSRFLDGATNLKEWQDRLPRLRREYLDMLGLWPLPERTPLHATVTGTLTRDAVAIDKLHFQSKPGLYVTGNLYRPKDNDQRLPAILYVCGHSGRGRDGNKTAFQDHGMWFARNGYVCLVIDTLQLGEIPGKHHGTYNLGRWWWHSLAYTPAGVECWNGIRAIDYLVSRKDVDPDRIGVTGISGGGATTVWVAAADERVKVAVPVSGMSDLESYVANKVINGHCDCMFVVNLYGWEWTTIAALIAPRPMLFANSDNDPIFPMDGNRRIIARLRQVYGMYGKGELVDDYVSKGGHDYRPDLRVAIFRWMNKHLKGETSEVKDAEDKPLPGKELRVFAEDKDLPKDAINGRVDEVFVAQVKVKLPDAKGFAAWQKEMIAKLREGPFRNLGERKGLGPPEMFSTGAESGTFVSLSTEKGVEVSITGPPLWSRKKATTLVVEEEDSASAEKRVSVPWHSEKEDSWVLSPRGHKGAWTRKNPPNTVERSYVLLGKTVDLGRLRDTIETARHIQASGIRRIAGKGQAGVLAAYAALLEPSINEVLVIDPPASHRDGPHFLGILRHLDIPETLGLLAPRKLTIHTSDPAFQRTKEIYKLAGAADKLTLVAPPRSRIDPRGVAGTLVLANNDADAALARFAELAGGEKAKILLVGGRGSDPLVEKLKPAKVVLHPGGKANLDGVTGVWLIANTDEATCAEYLAKARLVGASGAIARQLARLVPDLAITFPLTKELPPPPPGQVQCEINRDAALIVRGRRLSVAGDGTVTLRLAPCKIRGERTITLQGKQLQDLTALRRAARDRADEFPPPTVGAPHVASGSLVIIGGGGIPKGLIDRFVELAGGKEAKIVVLPTAVPKPSPRDGIAAAFRKAGAKSAVVLPGNTPDVVESKEYLDTMKEATGIWFGGGRQWHFVDAYENTKLLPLMHDVLKRGGVIGGSSAGATIQGEYLCRGGVFTNFDIAYEGYERGFSFLPGVAIDQHFAQRKRFKDMSALMKLFPQYLGIGLDETTAIVVRGSVAEVVGKNQVHFYDAAKPEHDSLSHGARYDLKARKVIAAKKE
jgi:cyanophycinase